jgi:hypothetical protein
MDGFVLTSDGKRLPLIQQADGSMSTPTFKATGGTIVSAWMVCPRCAAAVPVPLTETGTRPEPHRCP